eukprot:6471097-Amphidinium_carterae.1
MEAWSSADVETIKKSLALLKKVQGNKSGNWNTKSKKGQNKDTDKGFGRSSTGPTGWHCSSCKLFNFSHRSACLQYNAPKGVGFPPAGSKGKTNSGGAKEALEEQLLKKQIAEAKDDPELKEHVEAALAAVTAKKTNALPVKDQRAKLLAQAKAIANKMDQKAKLTQEAMESRDSLREELVEEELPLPKTEPLKPPASFQAIESLVAFAQKEANNGDKEAQSILESKELEEALASAASLLEGTEAGTSIKAMEAEEEIRLWKNHHDATLQMTSGATVHQLSTFPKKEPCACQHHREQTQCRHTDLEVETGIHFQFAPGIGSCSPQKPEVIFAFGDTLSEWNTRCGFPPGGSFWKDCLDVWFSDLATVPLCQFDPTTAALDQLSSWVGLPWKGDGFSVFIKYQALMITHGSIVQKSMRKCSTFARRTDQFQSEDGQISATISLDGWLMWKGTSLRIHESATFASEKKVVWMASSFSDACFVTTRCVEHMLWPRSVLTCEFGCVDGIRSSHLRWPTNSSGEMHKSLGLSDTLRMPYRYLLSQGLWLPEQNFLLLRDRRQPLQLSLTKECVGSERRWFGHPFKQCCIAMLASVGLLLKKRLACRLFPNPLLKGVGFRPKLEL